MGYVTDGKKAYSAGHKKRRRRLKAKYRLPLIMIALAFIACVVAIVVLILHGRDNNKPPVDLSEIGEPIEGGLADYSFLLNYTVDPWRKQVTFYYPGDIGGRFGLYLQHEDGTTSLIGNFQYESGIEHRKLIFPGDNGMSIGCVQYTLNFGEGGEFSIPADGAVLTFVMTADNMDDSSLKGRTVSKIVEIDKDSFSNLVVNAICEDLGDNCYRFTWNETAGDSYVIQVKQRNNEWGTYAELGPEALSYDTGHLSPVADFCFRIAVLQAGEVKNVSDEFNIHTDISITYATVWPTQNLTIYSTADKSESIGTAQLGKSYCVLDAQDNMLHIYTPDGSGYIDGNWCLINLPEYLGGLCNYDITNSYFSNYMTHEYEIKGVTGMITQGYEHVLLADGTFLAPLLYPVTAKLIPAAQAAREDGFRLKIYDSFRPYVATRSIYDITELQLDRVLPAETMQRVKLPEYLVLLDAGLIQARYTDPDLIKETLAKENEEINLQWLMVNNAIAAGQTVTIADPLNPDSLLPVYDPETGAQLNYILDPAYAYLIDPTSVTYRVEMLDNRYPLNDFLAQNGSRHNQGIALDLTLEYLDTGEELLMQTRIHDLTFHSEIGKNNATADLLASYMEGAGFHDLYSEWWHFQDNDVWHSLNPNSVRDGVSIEGWKVDDFGIRYRLSDGTYAKGIYTVDGVSYDFGENGYLP